MFRKVIAIQLEFLTHYGEEKLAKYTWQQAPLQSMRLTSEQTYGVYFICNSCIYDSCSSTAKVYFFPKWPQESLHLQGCITQESSN